MIKFNITTSVQSGKIKTEEMIHWLNKNVGDSGVDWKIDTRANFDHWKPDQLFEVTVNVLDSEHAAFFALTWL